MNGQCMKDTWSDPIRVLLVGMGSRGREHLDTVIRHPGFTVAGLVDSNGFGTGNDYPYPVAANVTEFDPHGYDVAILATPPSTYRDLCPELIGKNKHLLVEKPFGLDVEQAIRMTRMALEQGVVIQPAVQRRFHPSYQAWEDFRDRVGVVREAFFTLAIRHTPKSWRADPATAGGGVLFDLGFHAIDLALRWFGPMRLVYAAFYDADGKVIHGVSDARAELLYETETGVPVRLSVCRGSPEKVESVRIRGENGVLDFDRSACVYRESPDASDVLVLYKGESGWDEAMTGQMDDFCSSIRAAWSGRFAQDLSPWDGIHAMKMMKEAYARVTNG